VLWLSISAWVTLSRDFVLKTKISFWSWIALLIAWNLPSVIMRSVSEVLSRAVELHPRMWPLWCAPCFIMTFFPRDSR